jgi:acetyl esterase
VTVATEPDPPTAAFPGLDPALTLRPAGVTDVAALIAPDALAHVDPDDPAMPSYRVIANNRQPAALRDLMIAPVRSGYVGGDGPPPDPALVPRSGAEAVPDVDVAQVWLPVRGGVVRGLIYRARSAPPGSLPAVLYAHGGGFTVGSCEDTDYVTRRLAADSEVVVLSVDYRLAPEHPFPAGLDDLTDVYRWLLQDAGRLGGDPSCVVVAGDSAGSNLAAALSLRARDEGLVVPAAVVMLGAFVDFVAERWPSFRALAPRGVVYDSAFFGFIRGAYLPTTAWDHPWASPLHASDAALRGYPPTLHATGTHDPIIDSARAFAERLRRLGTPVVEYCPEGMPHGFCFFPDVHPEGDAAYAEVARFLAEVLDDRIG